MPIYLDLWVGDRGVSTVAIGRMRGGTNSDDVNLYAVMELPTIDRPLGWDTTVQFEHRYGDGLDVCVRKALAALAGHRLATTSPPSPRSESDRRAVRQQDRDALREHYPLDAWYGAYCGCCDQEWPCDVVEKVMFPDATPSEVHGSSEVSAIREVCDHWVGVKGSGHYRYGSTTPPAYWTHTYCPKCGEKL